MVRLTDFSHNTVKMNIKKEFELKLSPIRPSEPDNGGEDKVIERITNGYLESGGSRILKYSFPQVFALKPKKNGLLSNPHYDTKIKFGFSLPKENRALPSLIQPNVIVTDCPRGYGASGLLCAKCKSDSYS